MDSTDRDIIAEIEESASVILRKEFGAYIREVRKDLRLTQAEASRLIGIHAVQLARIEYGESGTKRETVIAIAKAYKQDVSDFLNRAGYSAAYDSSIPSGQTIELPGGAKIMGIDEDFDEDDLREIKAIMELKLAKYRNKKHET
jgi:transcriptional regulator with XRE-family HTH domain